MVHRIGRVLRLHKGKMRVDILFLADFRNAKKAGDLLTLLEVVGSSIGFSRGIKLLSGDRRLKSMTVVPLTREELLELRGELEASVRSFWNDRVRLSLAEAKEIVRRKGIASGPEFRKQRKTDPELQQIPSHPNVFYKNEGWISWPAFLGTNRLTRFNRFSLAEAQETVRRKGIKTQKEFRERRKTDSELQQIPSAPNEAYQNKGWVSWSDYLGINGVIRVTKFNQLSFRKAKSLVRRKSIKTQKEFRKRRKTDPELQQIPSTPDKAYKDEGWVNWPDFLGTRKLSLAEAKTLMEKKGIKTKIEFWKQRKTDSKLQQIPIAPDISYKNKGWVSWMDFLGTNLR